ncbi:helix-turn-helix domain-containing protein [Sulfobacillus thermosulfidooxidans]|uniref:helix-turn-helix domain-containing protein n=1 Tax=Sulfobacillus thermosulfidooxidans TaxID=28034 RepID=UPI001300F718|nr:helix-turn-helix domain-containing protein [Sulfobacillus thermosulfidooxidans]
MQKLAVTYPRMIHYRYLKEGRKLTRMAEPYSVGHRIRFYREHLGWSQTQLARKVALSQKQLSRIEQSQVMDLSRDLVILIGRALKQPVINGELNQWLYHFGYRGYVEPLLDLPDEYRLWLSRFDPFPAALLDIGWFLRDWNVTMARLFQVSQGALQGLERNLIVQLFAPDALLAEQWPKELLTRMLHRLMVQWQPYENEPWLTRLKNDICQRTKIPWETLINTYCQGLVGTIPSTSEVVVLRAHDDHRILRFRSNLVPIPNRPDLIITHYYPIDVVTEKWCWQDFSG